MSSNTSTSTKVITGLFVVSLLLAAFTGESRSEREIRQRQEAESAAARFSALSPSEQMATRQKELAHQIPLMVGAIKSNLRAPDSFKQDGITAVPLDNGKVIRITITYRAQNGFGGMNRESSTFTYHWDNKTKNYIL